MAGTSVLKVMIKKKKKKQREGKMSKVCSEKISLKAAEISTVTLHNYFSTHLRLIQLQAAEKKKKKGDGRRRLARESGHRERNTAEEETDGRR